MAKLIRDPSKPVMDDSYLKDLMRSSAGDVFKGMAPFVAGGALTSAATGGAAAPVDLDAMKKMADRIKKETGLSASSTGAAIERHDWIRVSTEWLIEKHPEYIGGSRGAPEKRLLHALSLMSYLQAKHSAEVESKPPGAEITAPHPGIAREEAVRNWSAALHRDMKDFLANGGYPAELRLERGKLGLAAGAAEVPDEDELLTLESDGSPEADAVAASGVGIGVAQNGGPGGKKEKAPKAAEGVIEQSLDDIARMSDQAGSW